MNEAKTSKNVIYNTIGTFFYFFCQWLTTILVVRISGYEDAGILSIVISFTNIFYFIALFGVRNFQVTDINHEFTDRDYLNSRHITSGIALILFVISLFCMRFSQVTVICCILYMIFKVFEGYTDVIFGIWQNHDGYFEILVSYIGKGILTIAGFCIGLYLFNLPIAIAIQALLYFCLLRCMMGIK